MASLAWVGLGAMGAPMAARLAAAGHRIVTLDLRENRTAEELRQSLEGVSVAFTCLPGPSDVESAWCGSTGLLACLPKGSILIDVSTVGPALAKTLAERAVEHGHSALDCPVSGGPSGAEAGTLAIMAGGSAETLERVSDVLAVLGTVTHCGEAGAGQSMKLINQTVLAGMLGGLGMGYAMAERAGADLELTHRVLSGGVVRGFLLDALWPLMASEQLVGGFAATHMVKDIGLAREQAAAEGISESMLESVEQWLRAAIEYCGPTVCTQGIGKGVLA